MPAKLQPHRIGILVRLLALGAQHADESLGHDGLDGTGDEERLDAHVDQTRDGAGGVVGVQGAEDQVAGQGGLDGDFGDFLIADFADQNDVGRLAQHRREESWRSSGRSAP